METRQLQPIYAALEVSDSNRALKECDKLLHKHSNHHGARALKTFILAKAGRIDEALALGRSLLDSPTALASSHAQQSLSMAFRVLGRPHDEMAVYKSALLSSPDNESLYCKLFLAAARNGLFKEQHMSAVKLNKMFANRRYVWWFVVSLLLQAKRARSEDSDSAQVQLTLAERMAEKSIADGQRTNAEELRVYLDVLEAQGKHAQMAEVLGRDGHLATVVANDPDLATQRIELLISTAAYQDAAQAAMHVLEVRDNWADYELYIKATVALASPASANKDRGEAAVAEICANLHRWSAIRGRERGAKLALVALSIELQGAECGGQFDTTAGVPVTRIWSYVDAFLEKAICFSDIMQFIVTDVGVSKNLDLYEAELEKRLAAAAAAREAMAGSEDQTQAWVNLEKIRYLVQALKGDTDPQSWMANIVPLLEFGLDSNAARKKRPSCSDMVLIAAQRIVQAAFLAFGDSSQRSPRAAALFKALCVLESGIRMNDSSTLLKLYAIRLYLYLSCYERARALFDTLSIKHIQMDTLGHLIVGQGMALGCFMPDLELCYDGVTFYDGARAKIPRSLESVYENGTYSNIQDFMEFQSNLAESLQHECTHRCALRGEAFESGGGKDALANWEEANVLSIEHTDESLSKLHDNRDLTAMGLLTPKEMAQWDLESLTRPAPLPGRNWIQAFSLIPQVMHYLACDDIEQLETRTRALAATLQDNDGLSAQDTVLIRGIVDISVLYTQALTETSIEDQLDKILDPLRAHLHADQFDAPDAGTLGALSSTVIRDVAVASELYSYVLTLKQALLAKKLPVAHSIGLQLVQLRKETLKSMNVLRAWIDKCARSQIDEQWLDASDGLLSDVTQFVVEKQKQSVAIATKGCVTSWLRPSIEPGTMQTDGHYNYTLMTTPALLYSADKSWFAPLPTDDVDVDLAQIMPLPGEDVFDGFYEEAWSDLNKKALLN
ncbi:mitochondrial distribution and morphology [Coemansia sp. RSA 552]|nr:mitochondrial distribution and morphology [Coemansia sp. RSA 552]